MNIKIHDLKCDLIHLISIISGEKKFEIRINDRDYKKGDFLLLREYCRHSNEYGSVWALVKVIYTLDDPEYCKEGFVAMGIHLMDYRSNVRAEVSAMRQHRGY